jgi:hypothetical protein
MTNVFRLHGGADRSPAWGAEGRMNVEHTACAPAGNAGEPIPSVLPEPVRCPDPEGLYERSLERRLL